MLRLLIVAHAPLASAMRLAAAHVDPDGASRIAVCDVRADHPRESVQAAVTDALASLGDSEVLILADIFGATPCNVAAEFAGRPRVRVLAGLNVTMVWRALGHLTDSLDHAVALLIAGGKQGVMQVGFTGPQHQATKPSGNHDPNDDRHQQ